MSQEDNKFNYSNFTLRLQGCKTNSITDDKFDKILVKHKFSILQRIDHRFNDFEVLFVRVLPDGHLTLYFNSKQKMCFFDVYTTNGYEYGKVSGKLKMLMKAKSMDVKYLVR